MRPRFFHSERVLEQLEKTKRHDLAIVPLTICLTGGSVFTDLLRESDRAKARPERFHPREYPREKSPQCFSRGRGWPQLLQRPEG